LTPTLHRGLRWTLIRQTITGITGTLGVLVYARLLNPADLGAVALAVLVYNGLLLLVQVPIRDAIVYYQEEEETHSSAAFWLLLGFGTFALVLVMVLAVPLGRFYESPEAAGLARAITVAFYFEALAVVPAALLLKGFRYRIHEGLQLFVVVINMVGWIGLALAGFGPWSLVLPRVVGAIFWAFSTWLVAGFRPLLNPGQAAYRGIIRFSRSLMGSKLLIYLKGNIDQAAVGTLGETSLGWYSFGESQSAFAFLWIGLPIAEIALPALASVRERVADLRRTYFGTLRLTATLSTPMQIGAIILADLGIRVLFGPKWLGAVPVFRAYLTFRLVHALLALSDATTSALGRPEIRFRLDLVQLPFFLIAIWFGLQVSGGIEGVAWSLAVVRAVAGLVFLVVTRRLVRATWREMSHYLLPSTIAAVGMGVLVFALRNTGLVEQNLVAGVFGLEDAPRMAELIELTFLVLAGVAAYLAFLFLLSPSGFRSVVAMSVRILLPEAWHKRLDALRRRS
jgi:O-antigen/teichoic acid export membrane protein